ncbi:MAG: SDR family oxidoreductase [Candidatus Heimdallarchaeota archaeon]|nr:SDR family oxidoreductase [Candidatus Heimdallarchaeota archaeon]MCK4876917.1 SDR family oxidoreductase [Candidatus Heimdallarchaeota archaeon]
MKNRTVIITGANAGIGKETFFEIAEMGANVIMVCRNRKKGERVLKEIKERTKNENLELMICDFSSLKSINSFVKKFKEKYEKLDVLINNHGAFFIRRVLTEDGVESTFAVNHLGYFSLTFQLLDLLKAGTKPRIVNVSSSSNYRVKEWKLDDYNWDKRRYNMMQAYAESKLYNILFTFLLAEKLKETNITANCLHPGYIKTNIGLNSPFLKLLRPLVKMKALPLEEGAKTSVYLATSPKLEGITGEFYSKMEEKKPNEIALNKTKQKQLWDLSLKITDLQDKNLI